MAQTTLNVRMDEELKKQFDELCSEIGMNMSTAVCIFAKKAVREQKIPFELTVASQAQPVKNEPDVSNRIGVAKGKLRVPKEFNEWDKEVEELFKEGDTE